MSTVTHSTIERAMAIPVPRDRAAAVVRILSAGLLLTAAGLKLNEGSGLAAAYRRRSTFRWPFSRFFWEYGWLLDGQRGRHR